MKAPVILFLSFALSGGMMGQEKYLDVFPLYNGKVTYSEIIETSGIATDELHLRAGRWFADHCEIIKLNEKDIMVGQVVFVAKNSHLVNHELFYVCLTITLHFKDGRYKYDIYDFRIKSFSVANGSSYLVDESLEDPHFIKENQIKKIEPQIKDMILSLVNTINTPIDDNW
jgi:hypothetical protein